MSYIKNNSRIVFELPIEIKERALSYALAHGLAPASFFRMILISFLEKNEALQNDTRN